MTTAAPKGRSVLIVGGGSAGWLTAAYMAKVMGNRPDGVSITLMESPEIGIIGVGEGTFPTIRDTLRIIGIEEAQFMRECEATFKQGIRFDDWEFTPQGDEHSHYLHPFEPPHVGRENINLVPYWLLHDPAHRPPLAEAVTFQKRVTDARLGPKRLHHDNYTGPLNYAYHFDAGKFAALLGRRARELGVQHLSGRLTDVVLDDTGAIDHIVSAEHGRLTADIYIDCTGFRSELLGQALKVPFHSIDDMLLTDRAVACQVPYATADAALESYTISTAHEAGWTWDIGLPSRRGVGYVYSSRHSSDERAEEILHAYVRRALPDAKDIPTRRIRFEAGYRTSHWVKNCVAIGLSAGFLEPLESTGMVLIESAVNKLVEFFPHTGAIDASADIFNDQMIKRYDTIIDFIKLHYCLTRRTEPFWRDNTRPESMSPRLRHLLALWKHRPPSRYDFILDYESFAFFSYQYILYGMNYETDLSPAAGAFPRRDEADQVFARIRNYGDQASRDLIPHRSLIRAVYDGGFIKSSPMPAMRR